MMGPRGEFKGCELAVFSDTDAAMSQSLQVGRGKHPHESNGACFGSDCVYARQGCAELNVIPTAEM